MDPQRFLELLKDIAWDEKSLTQLCDLSNNVMVVGIGIRESQTDELKVQKWSSRIQQSLMEMKIINLLLRYINGDTAPASITDHLQVSGRNRRIINLTDFSEQFTTNCDATIGPDKPITYNGFYIRDDFFPAKHSNGIT
ncbi:unnamed protein product [Adineta steineri]|nr:unnamed protein product [Adineta steineri]